MRHPLSASPLAGALLLCLAACSAGPADTAPGGSAISGDSASGDGHGSVVGAAEVAEPQLGLTTIDPSGTVTHLDLLDETVTEIGRIGAPTSMATDGRYLFAETADGLQVVDSGVWTWDHVDHFHYYRTEPRLLGTVDAGGASGGDSGGDSDSGAGGVAIATTTLSTTGGTGLFFADSGDAVLLDTEALSKGEITERFRIATDPHAGMVVPVGSFALVTHAQGGTAASVVGYTAEGDRTGIEEPCPNAAGTITTRVGAVIGCSDGALLASVESGELTVERIPYPDGTTAPAATSFDNREGRPTVAALAGTEGIWLLDTRERSWTLLPSPAPLAQVAAVDDDAENVLALTQDGRMLVLGGEDGSLRAQTEPLVQASLAAGGFPRLMADQQRAYLSAPVEHRLFEIDFADGARIARTFDTPTEPAFTAETGR
ncbi:ABC transporter [Herbiconiux liukaitaii]|uniref:ABC transporter n=1 Tax=Herbiconiux liukaitaii TaxID=3342799 RepID=UPI0035B92620